LLTKISKLQGPKHKWPLTIKRRRFKENPSSSSVHQTRKTDVIAITPAINTIDGLKKQFCSLAIKARDSPCTRGGELNEHKGEGDGRKKKKEEEEQTCIPLFLLKETEEAKEKKATNRRQKQRKRKKN